MMRFIGDVHSKFPAYVEIANAVSASIQVGDFGAGFAAIPEMPNGARFIRGNHDDPTICRSHSRWIPDTTFEDGMFFLGGGMSIDQYLRTEGIDWWPDEELSMGELFAAVDRYEEVKPDVMISHECPSDMAPKLFGKQRPLGPSRTSQALGSMLYLHRPQVWLFGHWHQRRDQVIDGVRFICLPELGYIDL